MKRKPMKKNIIWYIGYAVALTTILLFVKNVKTTCSLTEAENEYLFSLIDQGYTYEQARDEIAELQGYPCPYGTGGIDGVCKYGSRKEPAGGSGSGSSHTHVWIESITKEPSCTEEGEATYTCSCGKTKTSKIAKVDHEYEVIKETPATCKEYRKQTFKCKNCTDSYDLEFSEEGYADHIYIPADDGTEADCENAGKIHHVCNVCGDEYWEEVEALGHSFTKYTIEKEPTCKEEGLQAIYCDNCGIKREGSDEVLPKLEHVEKSEPVVKEATFFKAGKETYICETCGEVLREEVIEPTGGLFRYIIPAGGAAVLILIVVMIIILKKKEK